MKESIRVILATKDVNTHKPLDSDKKKRVIMCAATLQPEVLLVYAQMRIIRLLLDIS